MKFTMWLAKTILTAAIAVTVSLAVSWAVVNAYVRQLLTAYGAGAAVETVGFADTLAAFMPGKGGSSGQEKALGSGGDGATGQTEPGADDNSGQADPQPAGNEAPPPHNALPVMGGVSQSENQAGGFGGSQEQFYVSMEELNEKKNSMSDEERMEIFAMLITKLPPAEVQSISALLEDGLDAEELESAAAILQQYLSEEEFARLVDMLQQ